MAEADKDLRAFMDHIKFLEKKVQLLTRENQRLRAALELVHQTPPPTIDLSDESIAELLNQENDVGKGSNGPREPA